MSQSWAPAAGAQLLAAVAARAGRRVTLWARDGALLVDVAAGENPRYLPGVELPDDISVTSTLSVAAGGEVILLAVPAQVTRAMVTQLLPLLPGGALLVICAKGIEKRERQAAARTRGGSCARPSHRHPLRSQLCARSRIGPAHRRHHRGGWRGKAAGDAVDAQLPSLCRR